MYDLQSINAIIILFHKSNLRGRVYELIEYPSYAVHALTIFLLSYKKHESFWQFLC
jgi:hypothetical protein